MKFECNCKTDRELREALAEIHNAEWGTNFEVVARLWYTGADNDTVMVEFQVTTMECRKLVEDMEEPDWIAAYSVENEDDDNPVCEVYLDPTDPIDSIEELKAAMLAVAKSLY